MSKRQYSDNDKANTLLTLESNAGNMKRTSRETGVPLSTIKTWRDGRHVVPEVADICTERRPEMAERLSDFLDQLLVLMPQKAPDASLPQLATAYGVCFDKRQILKNLPTSINENRSENAKQIIDRYIADCAKDGVPVTREVAIADLSAIMPDLVSNEVQ